ncbi:unnamed protein product, partial [Rotaria sp. Silwood2]
MYASNAASFNLADTAYTFQSLKPEFVIDSAQHIPKQVTFGGGLIVSTDDISSKISSSNYNLILRNCECLAFWCKTGLWYGEQIEKVVDWVSTPLLTFLKAIGDYLVTKQIIGALCQGAMSEAIERAL